MAGVGLSHSGEETAPAEFTSKQLFKRIEALFYFASGHCRVLQEHTRLLFIVIIRGKRIFNSNSKKHCTSATKIIKCKEADKIQ